MANLSPRWEAAIGGWTRHMVVRALRPRTIELRTYQLGRLGAAHLHRDPWTLTDADLVRWLAVQTWQPETFKSYRSAIQGFYRWGAEAGYVPFDDPAAKLPSVRTSTPPPKPATDDAVYAAIARANDRDRLILMLAAYAGLRVAEIAAMRWADISPGALRVEKGKGGRSRVVPLHPELAGALAAELARRARGTAGSGYRYGGSDGVWVFPGQSGGHLDREAVGKAASAALGPGWTAHALRHRFATRAYAGTRDLLAVQALLGHAKPETTKRYTSLADESLVAAVRAV